MVSPDIVHRYIVHDTVPTFEDTKLGGMAGQIPTSAIAKSYREYTTRVGGVNNAIVPKMRRQ
jgi:hypothetical protein